MPGVEVWARECVSWTDSCVRIARLIKLIHICGNANIILFTNDCNKGKCSLLKQFTLGTELQTEAINKHSLSAYCVSTELPELAFLIFRHGVYT